VTGDEYRPVAVSRRICAPAHDIFQAMARTLERLDALCTLPDDATE
jgi:hypothetical protein